MQNKTKIPASADAERGKRLEIFLKEKFPDDSWRSRSKAIGINDSTVIGWRRGREISGEGLARLHEIGCDIYWLLTGNAEPPDVLPYIAPDHVKELESRIHFLEAQNLKLRNERDRHIAEIGVLKYRLKEPFAGYDDNWRLHDMVVEGDATQTPAEED